MMTKAAAMRGLLSQGLVEVFVNPNAPGVVLPENTKRETYIVLIFGYNLAVPILDLDVGEEGISAVLSFNRTPTRTFLPWCSVFVIRTMGDCTGYIDPMSTPPGIVVHSSPLPGEPSAPVVPPFPAHLGSVPMETAPDDDTEEIPTSRGRPSLKVVN